MKDSSVRNRLAEIRQRRGLRATELAQRVKVSRQTIYAIEAGDYVPNTEVALRLARELDATVDELFSLESGHEEAPELLAAEVLSASQPEPGQAVRVGRIGTRWVGVPATAMPCWLPEADGVIRIARRAGRAEVAVLEERAHNRVLMAGCDPATGLLARMVEKISGVEIVYAGGYSSLALRWLKEGKVHIAGTHLSDPTTGEFNLPLVRHQFPVEDVVVVTFASWEEGLVTRPGNPKAIRRIEDLARKNVTFVNREPGSGSRGLLDSLLAKAGIEAHSIRGYDRIAPGHLAAAYSLISGDADVCLATGSSARAFGLDFVPLRSERYDFVMRRGTADLPAVRSLLDVLQRADLRRKLEVLAGYDTSRTGAVVL